jgi:tetratricopeptide (TPR) repeat protein
LCDITSGKEKQMKDYFEILGVDVEDGEIIIDKAFTRLKEEYPINQYPEKNREIYEAYQNLKDTDKRELCISYHKMSECSKQAYKLAKEALENENYSQAVKILEKVIRNEDFPDILNFLMGIASLKLGKYVKASKAFAKLLPKYSGSEEILGYYALALSAKGSFRKAAKIASLGYNLNKNNFTFLYILAKGLIYQDKNCEAMEILSEALRQKSFDKHRAHIYSMMAIAAFYDCKYRESLEFMEEASKLSFENDEERITIGEEFLSILDSYISRQMFNEAGKCISCLMDILPDREEISEFKKKIEAELKFGNIFRMLEMDDAIPDNITGLIAAELFPNEAVGISTEQKEAYVFMSEYFILQDSIEYLIPLRHMKNRYPELYGLKKDFFDAVQDAKKRRSLFSKYRTNILKYKGTFYQLMSQLEDNLEDEFFDDGEYWASFEEDEQEEGNECFDLQHKAKVIPFIRKGTKLKGDDFCPCGSGRKYKSCCGRSD